MGTLLNDLRFGLRGLRRNPGFAAVATTLSEARASRSNAASFVAATTTSSRPGAGATAYALLNQMMAGDFRNESHFTQAATALSASGTSNRPTSA